MNFTIYTLFPEMFPGYLGHSLAGKGLDNGIWQLKTINLRDYAFGKHENVDDIMYGGGTGMVMRPDVVGAALDANLNKDEHLIYLSPRGKIFNQTYANELLKKKNISIICGRYEGMDQRVIDAYNIEEVSVGDFILSGGEPAALLLMDASIRLLDGVISKKNALDEESFGNNEDYSGLLEYPLYTRPSVWNNMNVPEILVSGNHAKINEWRLDMAKKITAERRPDLWRIYCDKQNKS